MDRKALHDPSKVFSFSWMYVCKELFRYCSCHYGKVLDAKGFGRLIISEAPSITAGKASVGGCSTTSSRKVQSSSCPHGPDQVQPR